MHGLQPYFGSSGRILSLFFFSFPCPSQGPVSHRSSAVVHSTSSTRFMAGYSISQGTKRKKNESPGGQRTKQESRQSLGTVVVCQENRRFPPCVVRNIIYAKKHANCHTKAVICLAAVGCSSFFSHHTRALFPTQSPRENEFLLFFQCNKQASNRGGDAVDHNFCSFAPSGGPFSFERTLPPAPQNFPQELEPSPFLL